MSAVLDAASLVVIIIVGYASIWMGMEANKTTKHVLEATTGVQNATKEVLAAVKDLAQTTEAVNRSIVQEARVQRIEGVLNVLIEMRRLFNRRVPNVADRLNQLESLALCRQLEAKLAPFFMEQDNFKACRAIADVREFKSNVELEDAITEVLTLTKDAICIPLQGRDDLRMNASGTITV